jgi:hypothetical protein
MGPEFPSRDSDDRAIGPFPYRPNGPDPLRALADHAGLGEGRADPALLGRVPGGASAAIAVSAADGAASLSRLAAVAHAMMA